MWQFLVRLILRNRLTIIIVIGLLTAFMAWKGSEIKMSYEMARMLPESDPITQEYEHFKAQFGQDGSIIFIAIKDPKLYTLEHFNQWYDISYKVLDVPGVQEVVSTARVYNLVRNDSLKIFEFRNIVSSRPTTQEQVDSIRQTVYNLPLYENRLFNKETHVSMMMITLDKEILNSKARVGLVEQIKELVDHYGEEYQLEVHYSGLPYIRTVTSKKVQTELLLFVFLSLLIASILLFILFRSLRAVLFAVLVVIIAVIWVLGTTVLLGYKITILTGILPPLLIVIGVENSIFLLNKYLSEYRAHGNKIKALSRMISRIGNANLLTNATTAAGFAAFIITSNELLVEFGIVASLNILITYLLSLFLLPILFSYFPAPKQKHMKHLEKGITSRVVAGVTRIIITKRKLIYFITSVLFIIAVIGITKLKTTGNIVDDISKKDKLYKDMIFLEENFKGVMPLEITIDTKKPKGILRLSTLQKIDQLQDTLETYPEFAKPLSVVEVVKSAKQAFYHGNPAMYSLPNNQEKNFILSYVPNLGVGKKGILNAFVDSNLQITRISAQMANIGTKDIELILADLEPKIDSIFPPDQFEVHLTGTSVVFLKGTNYLVNNLFMSLGLALLIITILMALIFSSARMIMISLVPNLIPQILTAGMMGYFDISIKPTTILIFSIALGISVDNTIHFLSRYRLQLKYHNWQIRKSVLAALEETGYSMIYSAIVLFFGFYIFTLSSFGGTEALGYLVSFTLIVALLSNLFVLPSLLLSLDKRLITKSFREPLMEVFDEEEDIELDQLLIEELPPEDKNNKT
ncbi:MAG: transporter [Bacteroidetes bacterium CG18_big_fil_WC_8_21_14_2_50_41_14]|nr:MAG: transporter [Bacteroidetes bacterium CG18_big_fil_WC_8_21_14_2_50_41_14]PJB57181.1 MAG: transporter [Bacteroidetes bacterium CG_4_9_14_3_um_filter_41_19]